ncbi:MAG TPA: hypothetical protein PK821_07060 [Victivallales bacterium]|nr:hypothetical protein [Victivallales bacterium]
MSKVFVSVVAIAILAFAFTGCKKEGAAEKAGKSIDSGLSDATKTAEKAAEEVKTEANELSK